MPEQPTIITGLDDFYEKFGCLDTLTFIEELEAGIRPTIRFIVSDGTSTQQVRDA